jgi:hypothetical protein
LFIVDGALVVAIKYIYIYIMKTKR